LAIEALRSLDFERRKKKLQRTLNLWITLTMQVQEVNEIDGAEDFNFRLPSSNEMHVIVNATTTVT
jgi:hypothetical protein